MVFAIILTLLLINCAVALFAEEDAFADTRYDITQRQLDRYLRLNYEESYNQFLRSSRFFDSLALLPAERFRFYSFESRLVRPSFVRLDFISNPLIDFFDYIPYEEYYDLFDQYYLSDITLFSLNSWGDIRINLSDMAQGDYFMKLRINLIRPRRFGN